MELVVAIAGVILLTVAVWRASPSPAPAPAPEKEGTFAGLRRIRRERLAGERAQSAAQILVYPSHLAAIVDGVEYWRCPNACGAILTAGEAEDHACNGTQDLRVRVRALFGDGFFDMTAQQLVLLAAQRGKVPTYHAEGGRASRWRPMWVCEYHPPQPPSQTFEQPPGVDERVLFSYITAGVVTAEHITGLEVRGHQHSGVRPVVGCTQCRVERELLDYHWAG